MTNLILNPGSGPVEGATEENACNNMVKLLGDAGIEHTKFLRTATPEDGGRFEFIVYSEKWKEPCKVLVSMPGLPLERVRFMDEPDQNIWHFPRLYVDGSSWVWKYAMTAVQEGIGREVEI